MIKNLTQFLTFFFLLPLLYHPAPVQAQSNRCPPTHIRDILKPVWDYRRPLIAKSITDKLTAGDPYVLYNTQISTNNLLEMAVNCNDTATIQEMVDMYLLAYPHLKPFGPGYKAWLCNSSACEIYKSQPIEYGLASTQFIYLLSRTANILAGLPTGSLSSSMREFLQKYTPVIANDHLHRWIAGPPVSSRKGWGCSDKNTYNHQQFLEKLLAKALGDTPTYCNVVTDSSTWIIAAAAEILAADRRSGLVTLTSAQVSELRHHVDLGTRLIQSRLTETSLTDFKGRPVKGLDFDRGMWRDYHTSAYAGYTGTTFPTENDKAKSPTVGWDFSHARRFVNVFTSLHDTRSITGQSFPDDTVLTKLANQVAYKIFNKDFNRPLFTNYWDGTNGWYRVGYSGRVGFAYAPSDLSVAFPTGGYGLWGRFNPDIDRIMESVWRIIDSTDPQVVAFRDSHYGSIWNNYQRTVPDWRRTSSTNLLTMLPTVITAPSPVPGDANGDGKVDGVDYTIWLAHYDQTTNNGARDGDFNSDRKVDGADYTIWLNNYQ